jgi:ubiquitin thioesterase protein OTUB1
MQHITKMTASSNPRTTTSSSSSTNMLSSDNITQSAQQEQDRKTRAQIDSINDEIKANQKLTSDLIPISELSNNIGGGGANKGFLQGCEYLATKYTNYRAIRGDGNCYYRAFLYALVETLYSSNNDPSSSSSSSSSSSELKRISDYINNSIDVVVQCGGYDRFAIETFHEEMVDLLSTITKDKDTNKNETDDDDSDSDSFSKIHNNLNEENGTSDYCVWYLRVITSTILKSDPDRFVHYLNDGNSGGGSDDPTNRSSSSSSSFITHYTDVPTYCAREIDPMGKECSMVGVLALAEAFQITVEIEYMDGKELSKSNNNNNNNTLIKHSFGGKVQEGGEQDGDCDGDDGDDKSSSALCITLLYRPGHYDILYK